MIMIMMVIIIIIIIIIIIMIIKYHKYTVEIKHTTCKSANTVIVLRDALFSSQCNLFRGVFRTFTNIYILSVKIKKKLKEHLSKTFRQ